jgi:glycosyltransferase involved in cell wall biosynthesis/GT2 family glycosyltransferase
VPRENPRRTIIAVLIGHEDPKVAMGLGVERRQQAVQLGNAVDRRDDEIECHGRTLTPVPLVSVLLAVHNDARFLDLAIASVLGQTVDDLELLVVDDASTDETPGVLAELDDPRVVALRNDEQLGLAASLNRGLERSAGRYVARLDADDVAHPRRLELQLERMRAEPTLALLGSAVLDLVDGRPGKLHLSPSGTRGVRWLALFSSPVFHPTVLVDREVLDAHGLRYDTEFPESEDYDLWTRLLRHGEGANLTEPLVLKRVHAGQATARRGDLQVSLAARVSLREIAQLAPGLTEADAEKARRVALGEDADAGPFLALLEAFESRHGRDAEVRDIAARMVMRAGRPQHALGLGPSHALRAIRTGAHRRRRVAGERRDASSWLGRLGSASDPSGVRPSSGIRVTVVSPEPTPYRSPLFDRVARRSEVDLSVIYAGKTVAGRTWSVDPEHAARYLRGMRVPGVRAVLRHDYPVTPGIARALRESRPDVLVVSGWSTYAAQGAIAWSRAHRIPYVLLVESHDLGPRAQWRKAVKGAVVPRLVRGASSVLVVGSAARESVVARGASPERVRVFANTVDVDAWRDRAAKLSGRRDELRAGAGIAEEDVVILSVARLVPEKGIDILLRAVAAAEAPRLRIVVAGSGPEARSLSGEAARLGVRLEIRGDLGEDALAQEYVRADVFALLSSQETWGVVVNEAAASGLPLVLSDRVGSAHDLLEDGRNGSLVASGDVGGAAAAFARLASDPVLRRSMGARSRDLVDAWGYEPSVDAFVEAVREATSA